MRKARPTESFFNFFTPPVPPADDALENDDIDEEALEELEEKLEIDYQLGEDFKEKASLYNILYRGHFTYSNQNQIIPRAVDFFTGKALEYMDDNESDYEDMQDDDDDEADFDDVCISLLALSLSC